MSDSRKKINIKSNSSNPGAGPLFNSGFDLLSIVKPDPPPLLPANPPLNPVSSSNSSPSSSSTRRNVLPPIITQAKVTAYLQADYLDIKSLIQLSITCRSARTLFSESLSKRLHVPGQKLLEHVVRGEQEQAEAMVQSQPELLFKTGTVIDYSGRTLLNVTSLTAAYGADDIDMLEMMFKYLDKSSRDQAIHHIKEKFPEQKESKSYNFHPLITAITTHDNIETTLKQFRKNFAPGAVKNGKHFDMKVLIAAYQAYNDNWTRWTTAQTSLFFRQVIGYLQRLLPTCYAQAFCQGFYYVAQQDKPLQRRLTTDDGNAFYPLSKNRSTGLGFRFGIFSAGMGVGGIPDRPSIIATHSRMLYTPDLKDYLQKKQRRCEILFMQPPDTQAEQAYAIR